MIPIVSVPERDEKTLVTAAAGGDTAAFEALVTAWQGRAWRLAMRMLGNGADAQDAVQEAFVSAWRGLDRFRDGQAFGPWIMTIVTRRCLNMLRSRKRSRVDDVDAGQLVDRTSVVEAGLERIERDRMLAGALRHLAPQALAVVVLHYSEDLPCARIAQMLEMSESAVKVTLFRARAKLRDILKLSKGADGRAL